MKATKRHKLGNGEIIEVGDTIRDDQLKRYPHLKELEKDGKENIKKGSKEG